MSATVGEQRSAVRSPDPAPAPAVSLTHVSKSFRLPHEQYHTLKERALHPFRKRTFDLLRAVQDVTVEIAPGEFFGVVGRNGSGKSTLLKCLAGIYSIDEGDLRVRGRLSPFIELGVGFNPDLTARDNVIINAIMLGLSRGQAMERFDDIIAFAELGDFVDLKLKNFSSGMYVRLAFATAVQVDADILLIDEVLAVGDAAFQQKCFDEFTRLRDEGRTIILVTHDMSVVERFCNRAMLLERGRVVMIDDPLTVTRRYNRINFEPIRIERAYRGGRQPDAAGGASDGPAEATQRSKDSGEEAASVPAAEILNAWFQGPDGEVLVTAEPGSPLTVRMDLCFHEHLSEPIFSVALTNEAGNVVFATNTVWQRIETGDYRAGETVVIRFRMENRLAPGRYRLFASVSPAGLGADVIDAHITNSILVMTDHHVGGIVDLEHTIEIERA